MNKKNLFVVYKCSVVENRFFCSFEKKYTSLTSAKKDFSKRLVEDEVLVTLHRLNRNGSKKKLFQKAKYGVYC